MEILSVHPAGVPVATRRIAEEFGLVSILDEMLPWDPVRIRPGVRFEPLEPVLAVGLDPALQRPEPDSGLVTARDLVQAPGDLPQQALALGRAQILGQYGGDEAPAEGGDVFSLLPDFDSNRPVLGPAGA